MKALRWLLAASVALAPKIAEAGGPTIPPIPQQVLITMRAPTPTDDATKGYSVGNLWQFNGRVWKAVRVTAGTASWQEITPPSLAGLSGVVGWVATSATETAGGSNYAVGDTIVLASGDSVTVATLSGTAVATVALANTVVTSASVSAGGSGYVAGDTITTPTGEVLTVISAPSGVIATVSVAVSPPQATHTGTQSSTSGSGTGATFTFTTQSAIEHATAVSGAQAQVSTSGNGTGATITLTGAGLEALYGTTLLNPLYTGSSFSVQRAGDTSATAIGFLPSGALNEPLLWSLCGTQVCRLITMYDQDPTRGNNMTFAFATAPTIDARNRTGSALSIVFDNNNVQTSTYNEYGTLPSGVSIINRAHSEFFAGRMRGGHTILLSYLGSTSGVFNFGTQLTGTIQLGLSYFGTCGAKIPGSESAAVFGYVTSYVTTTTLETMWNNDVQSTCANALGLNTYTGGYIGAYYSGSSFAFSGSWEFSALAIYGRSITPTEQTELHAAIYANQNIYPQIRNTVTITGDSITDAPNNQMYGISVNNQDVMRMLETRMSIPARIFNFAVYGNTLNTARCASAVYAGQGNAAYQAGATNVYIVQGSWNESGMEAGTANAYQSLYTDQVACAAQARTTGYNKVIVVDLTPYGIGPSAGIVANWVGIAGLDAAGYAAGTFDGYASFYNDPTLGPSTAPATNLYQADHQHITAYPGYTGIQSGISIYADLLNAQVSKFLHFP